MQLIDREIPYHILFLLLYKEQKKAWIGYKEQGQGGTTAFNPGTYYNTEWLSMNELSLRLDGLNMDSAYEGFIRQIAKEKLEDKPGGDIKDAVARDDAERRVKAVEGRTEGVMMTPTMSTSEKITYSTVLIRSQLSNGMMSTGTGFIMNLCFNESTKQCIPVIITNKHVAQNSILTVFEFVKQDANGMPLDREAFVINYQAPKWIMHPDNDIDLCCLPIAPLLNQLPSDIKVFYIPLDTKLIPTEAQLKELTALEEMLMIGYPIGLTDTYNHKPILRKGTTATHVKNDYQGKKDFLIDIACFPGSSGSPILILNEGAFTTQHGISVGSRIIC